MKTKLVYSLLCLFIFTGCEAQPNRPLTVIDKVDRLADPAPTATPNAIPSGAVSTIVVPSEAPTSVPDSTSSIKVLFKGNIYNLITKKPEEKAKITIGSHSVISGANGEFSIPDFPIGVYQFTVSKEGFLDYIDENFDVRADFGRTAIFIAPKPAA